MMICKWPDPPNDHLQEAGTSGQSFASGRSLQMIIFEVAGSGVTRGDGTKGGEEGEGGERGGEEILADGTRRTNRR